MKDFEQWFQQQDFYANLRFIYGDTIFTSDLLICAVDMIKQGLDIKK